MPYFLAQRVSGVFPVTDPAMTRFNISLDEGVQMVLWALENAQGGEIFVPKIPSYRIVDVAEAIGPECELRIVGIRPGEKIHEEMITASDSLNTVDLGPYYAILPSAGEYLPEDYAAKRGGTRVEAGFAYNSGTNPDFLTVDALRQLIGNAVPVDA
jgi:FlaA1/EpsC-like NDP-sugar epimerase